MLFSLSALDVCKASDSAHFPPYRRSFSKASAATSAISRGRLKVGSRYPSQGTLLCSKIHFWILSLWVHMRSESPSLTSNSSPSVLLLAFSPSGLFRWTSGRTWTETEWTFTKYSCSGRWTLDDIDILSYKTVLFTSMLWVYIRHQKTSEGKKLICHLYTSFANLATGGVYLCLAQTA